MVRGISLLRLSGLALAGPVMAGCAASTLTAQTAIAGVPVAVLVVAAAALALVATLLVWRRRQTSPSRGEGSSGWSVTADSPGTRDAVFSLAPATTPHAAAPPVEEHVLPEAAGPPPSEPDVSDQPPAGTVGHSGADPVLQVTAAPEPTEWLAVPPPSVGEDDPDTDWWSTEEAAADAGEAGTPDPAWDEQPEPTWDEEPEPVRGTGTRSWFDEPDELDEPDEPDEPDPVWNVDDPADDVIDPSSDRR